MPKKPYLEPLQDPDPIDLHENLTIMQDGDAGERQRLARELLSRIGQIFCEKRKQDRTRAYLALQQELMSNLGSLVPEAATLKEMLSVNISIEDFLKDSAAKQGTDPSATLAEFLNEGTAASSDPNLPI